jgi:hypothetical protein
MAAVVLGAAAVAGLISAVTDDEPGDSSDAGPTVVGVGDPIALEPDLQFTVLATDFDDRTGRLTAEVGYRNETDFDFGGPQFVLACGDPPAESEWADAMLGDSIEAIGTMASGSIGGGAIIVEYDLVRIAGCAEEPVLWVRSSLLQDLNGQRGHRTFQVVLEKPPTS